MDNNWQLFSTGYGDAGYGDNSKYADIYHGGGYGYTHADEDKRYTTSGTGGELTDHRLSMGGYGNHYPLKQDGCGSGEAYGETWSYGSGYGNGRSSDYYAAGYGSVNKDECREDGHGDGGMYASEYIPDEILYYHSFSDFNAYGGQD